MTHEVCIITPFCWVEVGDTVICWKVYWYWKKARNKGACHVSLVCIVFLWRTVEETVCLKP